MKSKTTQILDLLLNQEWVCVEDMLKLYSVDYRRRLCDIKERGYTLESRRCQQHNYHKGGSKEWKIVSKPPLNAYQNFHLFMQSK